MTGSAILGVALGALATAAYALVVALTFAYSAAIAADSATTTAGIIQVAEPRSKGTTMSLYAIIGFTGAFVGPVIFWDGARSRGRRSDGACLARRLRGDRPAWSCSGP